MPGRITDADSNGDSHRYRNDNTAAIPDADEYDQTSADAKAASHPGTAAVTFIRSPGGQENIAPESLMKVACYSESRTKFVLPLFEIALALVHFDYVVKALPWTTWESIRLLPIHKSGIA